MDQGDDSYCDMMKTIMMRKMIRMVIKRTRSKEKKVSMIMMMVRMKMVMMTLMMLLMMMMMMVVILHRTARKPSGLW